MHGLTMRVRLPDRVHKPNEDGGSLCGRIKKLNEDEELWRLLPRMRCKLCLKKLNKGENKSG